MRKYLWFVVLTLILGACQSAAGMESTMQAGDSLVGTEAAAMVQTAFIDQTQAVATLSLSGTELARVESVNQQIYETLVAVATPTPGLIVAQVMGDGSSDDMMLNATSQFDRNNRLLVRSGISTSIDPQTGCVISPTITFTADVTELFATMRVFNVQAGVPIRAEWYYEGELRASDEWIVDRFSDDRCVWFNVDTSRTEFTPGSWSVTVYMDGAVIDAPMPFSIVE